MVCSKNSSLPSKIPCIPENSLNCNDVKEFLAQITAFGMKTKEKFCITLFSVLNKRRSFSPQSLLREQQMRAQISNFATSLKKIEFDDELMPFKKGAVNCYPYFEEQELLRIWEQITASLSSLRHRNLCHREVCPSNILVTQFEDSQPKGLPGDQNCSLLKKIKVFQHKNMQEKPMFPKLVHEPMPRQKTFKFPRISSLETIKANLTRLPKFEELTCFRKNKGSFTTRFSTRSSHTRNSEIPQYESPKQTPNVFPLSPSKLHLRSQRLLNFSSLPVKKPERFVSGCKILISDNLCTINQVRRPLPKLSPENLSMTDLTFASPLIEGFCQEFHAWNKLIGKEFRYKTPAEEDVYSLGCIFLNTLVLHKERVHRIKRKVNRCKSSRERTEVITQALQHSTERSGQNLPYHSVKEMIKLISCCLNPCSKERPSFDAVLGLIQCMPPQRNVRKRVCSPEVLSQESSFDSLCNLSTDEKIPNKFRYLN
ncbi:unnamed protein product [Moneuplotes crassus]|uniref:Protein kinase domain-containing protein n=1 Tax=Euplotes crassus TaxID=5936 RepID=A0AAD1Y8S9_EUPCR|nr:unnamed protein product [Moneuplotes crassus]